MKGRALRRALETKESFRISGDVPLIVDTTELITPAVAQEMLNHNKANRPVNWKKVEEYAEIMRRGEWALHAQGIVIDTNGNLLTGQQRLWAVIYANVSVYMRVSRGNPPEVAKLLDRGRPQSARDLASRDTEKKHSPMESSIARGILALGGNRKPSVDELAATISGHSQMTTAILTQTTGTKKTKAVLMILAAICVVAEDVVHARVLAGRIDELADRLERALRPESPDGCWGKGAAFGLAMEQARKYVREA